MCDGKGEVEEPGVPPEVEENVSEVQVRTSSCWPERRRAMAEGEREPPRSMGVSSAGCRRRCGAMSSRSTPDPTACSRADGVETYGDSGGRSGDVYGTMRLDAPAQGGVDGGVMQV